MPYAQVNGIKIFYEIYGPELEIGEDYSKQRPTLIALHGGPGIDHTW